MDDDTVHISDSEESQAAISRLVKVIENWASKESQKSDYELSAFGAALATGIVAFHEISAKDCRASPGLMSAVSRAHKHLTRQHQQFDSEIDKMHLKFAQEMEELDLKIIRDRKEFKTYLSSLLFAEEYNKLRKSVGALFETLDAKANYREDTSQTASEAAQ
ncbi:MAG: hypothetical protein H8E24_05270 [Verrucomicrobia bacterium]|nr:hypothetical protein [Verrucomicrobiota bacterium]